MAFKVTYVGNGSTSGQVPIDNNSYNSGDVVPILPQSGLLSDQTQLTGVVAGTLAIAGGTFANWSTNADGSGDRYYWPFNGPSFTMTSNTTFYAQWYITVGLN